MPTWQLIALGVIAYLVLQNFSTSDLGGSLAPGASPTPTPAPTPTPTPTPGTGASAGPGQSTATQLLTLSDIASLPYATSGATTAQMNALSSQLDTELQAGQVGVIAGNSVAAYMLGWGSGVKGTSKSVYGHWYTYDGTNWVLQWGKPAGVSGVGFGPTIDLRHMPGSNWRM